MNTQNHPHKKYDALKLKSRLISIGLGIGLGLVCAGGVVAWQLNKDHARVEQLEETATRAQPQATTAATVGGPFTIKDANGKVVTDKDLLGKYVLINFGYTFCPDMCPTGLQSIAHAMKAVGDKAERIQPVFVSVDPARDTPEKLKEYVNSFDAHILALRGTDEETATIAKAYQVYYAKKESEDGPDQYEMDHTPLIYMMDRDGKFVTSFPDEVDPLQIVEALYKAWGEQIPPSVEQKSETKPEPAVEAAPAPGNDGGD